MGVPDIIILVGFIPALIKGFSKGFIGQLAALAAIVIGILAAIRYSAPLAAWTGAFIKINSGLARIICFTLILALSAIVLTILGRILSKLISVVMLGWLNRLLGIILSLSKAFLIIGLAVLLFDSINCTFNFVDNGILDGSPVYCVMRDSCNAIFPKIKELFSNA